MPHYCKVCQTYKANEKFSGKGHAAHICKKCKGKPLPKKEKTPKPKQVKNPFMKTIKIQEVIFFQYDGRMMIIFKRGSEEYVAYREDNEPYRIFQFIRKEERFVPTTAFDEEMAQYAIERKADYISIYVEDWEDFEGVEEKVEAYEQSLDNEEDEDDYVHDLEEGSFAEHYYTYAKHHNQLLLRNLYKLERPIKEKLTVFNLEDVFEDVLEKTEGKYDIELRGIQRYSDYKNF